MNKKCVHKTTSLQLIKSRSDPSDSYELKVQHCSLLNRRIGIQGLNCKKCKLKQIL
jgi:hypothetical protein